MHSKVTDIRTYKYVEANKDRITEQYTSGTCSIRGCSGQISAIILRKDEYRLVCSKHYCSATYKETMGTLGICRVCKELKLQVFEGECHSCYSKRTRGEEDKEERRLKNG